MSMSESGAKPPTSADVARAAGVSRSTVSYVLNSPPGARVSAETRERVLKAVRELGYAPSAPARSLRSGNSDVVLFPLPLQPMGQLLEQFIDEFTEALRRQDLNLLIHGDRYARGVDAARSWAALRPLAVMAESARLTDGGVEVLRRAGVRAIFAWGREEHPGVPTAIFDNRDTGAQAVRHLISRGHRRLACLVPSGPLAGLGQERWEGAKAAAEAAGCVMRRVDVGYVREDILRVVRGWQQETEPPTAVFAGNDDFALMIISALRECGWTVPGDMAVVGADDLPFCDLVWPRLTSVAMHTRTMGGGAADALTSLMAGKPYKHRDRMVVHPRVVVRESG
ncbi:LacI family DNA-binding transcriptional regulator [Yinghuangia seranimata]|uniref:LacI family DNA-binding transcriptional regulator n=1 Tax=Yinghuangia seranimata TaxID=408067 RepID=UPI00248BBE2D|nr:LacI family DNA-binding transcriptional regulator [Yinghuangia seranimata]MDI2126417.1 LacI family DNA-binding transcriptional regulator [Yinghuangia seranimata]